MLERARPKAPFFARQFLYFTLALLFIPLLYMVFSSFRLPGQDGFTFNWYSELFADSSLWQALVRSLAVAGFTGLFATLIGLASSLALDKWWFPLRGPLSALATVSLMLPELVLALSLLSWFALLHFELSLTTVIIAHVTLTLPFSTLVISARLRSLDRSFDDAARDLGAGEGLIFWRVTLPLLRPALIGAFLLAFLLSFDDFLVTFFTNGAGGDTLPVKLYSMMKLGLTPKILALSSFMLLLSMTMVGFLVRLRENE
jgi:spermidine/putrescine transport system permease protein